MKTLEMSPGDRAHHTSVQGLAIDSEGQEILVGLTREESEWLLRDSDTWVEQRQSGSRSKADKARYLELSEKHEVARLRGIGLTNLKPEGNA